MDTAHIITITHIDLAKKKRLSHYITNAYIYNYLPKYDMLNNAIEQIKPKELLNLVLSAALHKSP